MAELHSAGEVLLEQEQYSWDHVCLCGTESDRHGPNTLCTTETDMVPRVLFLLRIMAEGVAEATVFADSLPIDLAKLVV